MPALFYLQHHLEYAEVLRYLCDICDLYLEIIPLHIEPRIPLALRDLILPEIRMSRENFCFGFLDIGL